MPVARTHRPIRALLIDAHEPEYRRIRELLAGVRHVRYTVEHAPDLQTGLSRLAEAGHEVCLVAQELPDGSGLDLVQAAERRQSPTPIILLAERLTLALDLEAMALGVADVLDQRGLDAPLLERSIRYALARQRQALRLSRLAQHDELTGLANRSLFQDRLERALAWARRHERLVAVMVLDLNGFKTVNDQLGHSVGDRLLSLMARRLTARLRETDTVARLGGDEFALVIENLAKSEHAALVARKLLDTVATPAPIDGREVRVTASLGSRSIRATGRTARAWSRRPTAPCTAPRPRAAICAGSAAISWSGGRGAARSWRAICAGPWTWASSSCISSRRCASPPAGSASRACCAGNTVSSA